jgi:hypothetical protein
MLRARVLADHGIEPVLLKGFLRRCGSWKCWLRRQRARPHWKERQHPVAKGDCKNRRIKQGCMEGYPAGPRRHLAAAGMVALLDQRGPVLSKSKDNLLSLTVLQA